MVASGGCVRKVVGWFFRVTFELVGIVHRLCGKLMDAKRRTSNGQKVSRAGNSAKAFLPWDEPRMIVATKYCERCNRWFCQTHFGDPDWHSCTEEEQ
jgi:hypothetical protein